MIISQFDLLAIISPRRIPFQRRKLISDSPAILRGLTSPIPAAMTIADLTPATNRDTISMELPYLRNNVSTLSKAVFPKYLLFLFSNGFGDQAAVNESINLTLLHR